jgi:hypothetical protein
VVPDRIPEVQQRREYGCNRHPRRRHEQRVAGNHEHVQRRECGLGLTGEVDDRRDQTQVDQRLDQEERVAGLPIEEEDRAHPIASKHQSEHHRHADDERFLGPLRPYQAGPQQNARSQNETAYKEPGKQRPLVGKGVFARPPPIRHRRN